jgi:two-component system nitrogen regulation sensor histidine kinase GlnL
MSATKQAQYHDMLEHLATAVLRLGPDTSVGYINPAAESLLQLSARQALGTPLRRLVPSLATLEYAMNLARERDASYTEREHRIELAGSQPVTVDCTVTPLAGGDMLMELEQLDRHLRISRENHLIAQNHAIQELISGLAHEIKNPLGGLRGAAQLLQSELQDPDQREYTEIIIGEADRLRALVNSMLGPDGRPSMELTNIHRVLERVRQLTEAEAPEGVVIRRDYDPSIPLIPAANDQLIQAVLNLTRNALEAVGQQGCITLQTRTQRRFTIGNVQHNLVASINIIDDGPGIPPESLDRIFYPMITSRADGTGIGLPIAQMLVNQHGGLIECSSEPGHTVFTVWLPMEATDG